MRLVILLIFALAAAACTSDDAASAGDDVEGDATEGSADAADAATDDAAQPDAAGDDAAADVAVGPGASEVPAVFTRVLGAEGACGVPVAAEAGGLRRVPYLQSVLPDSARIAWTMTEGEQGVVRVGRPGEGGWQRVEAAARLFPRTETFDLVDYTAFDATVSGLEPGTVYCYEVLVDDALVMARGSFETAWRDPSRPLSLIAVGDSGNGSPAQLALAEHMATVQPDIFLHLGDMAYGDGTYVEFENHMFGPYQELLQAIPMWPTPGNHEYKTGIATPYIEVYYLPEQAYRAEEHEYYYSFDYGDVHFVSLDSNDFRYVTLFGQQPGSMAEWLRDDLAASDATWKIAFMHHPVYSSGLHGGQPWLLEEIVPILEEGGVDLVLVGHDHHYERTRQILRDEVAEDDPFAVTYIVAGAGGAGLREAPGDWFTEAVDDQTHNYLHLVIEGCTATGRALGANGEEVDAFVLDGCEE